MHIYSLEFQWFAIQDKAFVRVKAHLPEPGHGTVCIHHPSVHEDIGQDGVKVRRVTVPEGGRFNLLFCDKMAGGLGRKRGSETARPLSEALCIGLGTYLPIRSDNPVGQCK